MPLAEGAIAGLTAAASIANMAGSTAFNAAQSKKQREWSEKMTNQQNEWTLNMWNKANEYNTPENQVQRLREAGLNPLYYGLDGSSANAMQAAQPLGYDRANMGNLENPVGAAVGVKAQIAQSHLAEKQGDLAAQKAITESLLRDKQYDFLGVQIDLGKSQENLNEATIRKYAADIDEIEKRVDKMDVDILETYSKIDVSQRSQKLAEDTFEFSKALANANLSLREKEIAVQWYNANTQRLVGEADIQLKGEQKVYVQLQGEEVKAVTATENALRAGKVEGQSIENKAAEREYKWMPVEKTIKAVGTAAGIAGGIMLGSSKVAGSAAKAAAARYSTNTSM